MATSPSDHNNRNIIAWLDRLQASVRSAGGKAGPSAFKLDARGTAGQAEEGDSDSESDPPRTHAQNFGLVPPSDEEEGEGNEEELDKLQSSLPDSHVPLGLIANLSLSNNKKKHGKKEAKDVVAQEENIDDDDVVSVKSVIFPSTLLMMTCQGVANETYFMPG